MLPEVRCLGSIPGAGLLVYERQILCSGRQGRGPGTPGFPGNSSRLATGCTHSGACLCQISLYVPCKRADSPGDRFAGTTSSAKTFTSH
jgi:hypothetical protein